MSQIRLCDISRAEIDRVIGRKVGSRSAKKLSDAEIQRLADEGLVLDRPYKFEPKLLHGQYNAGSRYATVLVALR